MKIVKVYMEHPVMQLNTTFSYRYRQSQTIERGMRVKVDFHHQLIIGFVDEVQEIVDEEAYQASLPYQLKDIVEVIDQKALLNAELYELGLWMSKMTVSPIISCFTAMLPPSLKPSSSLKKAVKVKWVQITDPQIKEEYALQSEQYPLSEIKKYLSDYRLKKYRESGKIVVFEKEKTAQVADLSIQETPYPLTDQQIAAIQTIEESTKQVCLLHGLTGSGKTEVYMQLAKKVILSGKQVLILVPEISLTPMMVQRFKERFNNNIAVYHSGLNAQQKYEQYQLVKQKQVKIVIGTRSAVFMPFQQLGLIVLDEEHDHSYKQDSVPKYHTRDIAIKRSEYHGCKVVLGSATPTLESYARALKDVYQLVKLTKRVSNRLPDTTIVDMNVESRKGNFIISSPLQQAITQTVQSGKQAILLLNRRGYSPVMKCSCCNHTISCPHCDVAMSYHKDIEMLVCHSCGSQQIVQQVCPQCGGKVFRTYGVGTQRLQEEVMRICPEAKVVRMDADVTKKKDAHQNILKAFEAHEYDVLVGTQMISKGLDFPNVTLVGIFNADAPLARSDYRSVETTFDLIVQASGRSGRSQAEGRVFIQSYDVNHYGIVLASKSDYIGFFNREMNYRHVAKYPPYTYLIAISFHSKEEELSQQGAYDTADYFRSQNQMKVLGPSPLIRRVDEYRYRVILKGVDKQQMIEEVWQWYQTSTINRNKVAILVDVDPYVLD